MKLAEFIREAGVCPGNYPSAADIDVTVIDRKGRAVTDSTIKFVEPLFAKNPKSFINFLGFLQYMEEQLESGTLSAENTSYLEVKLEDTALIMRLHGFSHVFNRQAS